MQTKRISRHSLTSPHRGEVGFGAKRQIRVRGNEPIDRPVPPHPNPLPDGERGRASFGGEFEE